MRFSSGLLGVAVTTVAIVAALLGSWALSTDVSEVEVTTYSPIAEITGLFESTPAPEYIDYDPSTNYTGYYTEDSIINNTVYFDGVSYTASTRANNYRLNLAPDSTVTGTYALNQISTVSGDYDYVVYADNQTGIGYFNKFNDNSDDSYDGDTIALSDLVAALDPDGDYNQISLYSSENYDITNTYGATTSTGWCVFSVKSSWQSYRDSYMTIFFASEAAIEDHPAAYDGHLVLPCLSATVDMDYQTVTLYHDNAFADPVGLYSLSDVLICYGGGENGSSNPAGYIKFDTTINYELMDLPEITYMSPSKGVELDE